MISGIPIILVSSCVFSLISMTEVLKSLLFPFKYHGIIIPYEPKPQLKMILSSEPFIIGMEHEIYELISDVLEKQSVKVYDLEQREFLSPSNPSRIICKFNHSHNIKKKKLSFPTDFIKNGKDKLDCKIRSMRNDHKDNYKKIYLQISEVFYQFFIDSILDLKNMGNIEDYADHVKMIKMRRKNKEHKEFLSTFCLTETYKSFTDYLDPSNDSISEDGIHVEEFIHVRKGKGNNNEKKADDDK
jgi:hypothetical protein